MNEPVYAARHVGNISANACEPVLTHRAKYILVNRSKSCRRKKKRGKKQRKPLFLRFLVKKQCLVSRLVQQLDIGLPSN